MNLENANLKHDYDSVTGVFSMLFLNEYIEGCRQQDMKEKRSPRFKRVIYINIDRFRHFNESFGMQEGNLVLKRIAIILKDVFQTKYICRMSADHFVIFYEGTDEEERIKKAHDIVKNLYENYTIWLEAGVFYIDDEMRETPYSACSLARIACEEIKNPRKEIIGRYTDELKKKIELKKYIQNNIDKAIENKWLQLYYQPVIRSLTGRLASVEALSRWIDPVHGFISPGVFVPALEEKNLSYKLAKFVIDEVTDTILAQKKSGDIVVPVSINFSRKDFISFDPFKEIEKAVLSKGIERSLICIEITESTAMKDPDVIKKAINDFHNAGYEVWMDDFGSAYSSLNTLKDFDFDEIKIDMLFMQNLNDRAKSIVRDVIRLAKNIGIHTLCEGVETKEQLDFLRNLGCEKIQGFYYSKPLPAIQLKAFMAEKHILSETRSLRYMYEVVGKLPFSDDNYTVLISKSDNKFKIVYISDELKAIFSKLNISPETISKNINKPENIHGERIRRLINGAENSQKKEELVINADGLYFVIYAKLVAKSTEGKIFYVICKNITEFARKLNIFPEDSTLLKIVDLFDAIYDIDLVTQQVNVVSSTYAGERTGDVISYNDMVLLKMIYSKDLEQFSKWTDPEYINMQYMVFRRHNFTDVFRIIKDDGTKEWQAMTIIPSINEKSKRIILCIKPSIYSNEKIAKRITDEILISRGIDISDNDIKFGVLWQSLLEQNYIRLFWKDRERRFVGANKAFLDFYGLKDASSIIGKTDEEIGWHVDGDKFKNIEESVINLGKSFVNQKGNNIVNGKVMEIFATKFPIYNSGKIVGLMGYFFTIDEMLRLAGAESKKDMFDDATGLATITYLMEELLIYEDNFKKSDEDYLIAYINVENYWEIYRSFGEKTAEIEILMVASAVKKMFGEKEIMSRSDKQGIVIGTKEPAEEFKKKFLLTIDRCNKISHINGYPARPFINYGIAKRSESRSPAETYNLAHAKMLKNEIK